MSAHMTPEQVRLKIDHPIVDGDGHWVEYDPVFSERMRKVGGDLAADGFLKAMGTTRELLSMSVAERRDKRLGQQAFWARQAENTLDRATAETVARHLVAAGELIDDDPEAALSHARAARARWAAGWWGRPVAAGQQVAARWSDA